MNQDCIPIGREGGCDELIFISFLKEYFKNIFKKMWKINRRKRRLVSEMREGWMRGKASQARVRKRARRGSNAKAALKEKDRMKRKNSRNVKDVGAASIDTRQSKRMDAHSRGLDKDSGEKKQRMKKRRGEEG